MRIIFNNRSQEFSGKGKKKTTPPTERDPSFFKGTNKLLPLFSLILFIHPSIRSIEFKTSNAEHSTLAFEHFETNFRIEKPQGCAEKNSKRTPFEASPVHPSNVFLLLPIPPLSRNSDVAFSLRFAKPCKLYLSTRVDRLKTRRREGGGCFSMKEKGGGKEKSVEEISRNEKKNDWKKKKKERKNERKKLSARAENLIHYVIRSARTNLSCV